MPNSLQYDPLRNQLRAELQRIGNLLALPGPQDELTELIRLWHHNFSDAIRMSGETTATLDTYIGLLQELLCDRIHNAPLDFYPVLDITNGHTIGQMSLAVYLLTSGDTVQAVASHDLARHMVEWLDQHGAMCYSEALEEAYLALEPENPHLVHQHIQQMVHRNQLLDQEEARALAAQERELQALLNKISVESNQELDSLSQRVGEISQPLVAVQKNEAVALDSLRQKLQPLVNRIENFTQSVLGNVQQAEKISEKLDQEIGQLHQRNVSLQTRLHAVSDQVADVQKEQIKVEIGINETKKAIKKRKKEIVDMVKGVALVVGSIFATYALQTMLQTNAIGAAAAKQGNAYVIKIGYTF